MKLTYMKLQALVANLIEPGNLYLIFPYRNNKYDHKWYDKENSMKFVITVNKKIKNITHQKVKKENR